MWDGVAVVPTATLCRPQAAQPKPQAPRATYVDESDRDTDFNGMELDA